MQLSLQPGVTELIFHPSFETEEADQMARFA